MAGYAVEAIQGVVEEDDEPALVAVGRRGLAAAARRMLLGSVSTGLLRAASGPLLIGPPSSCRTQREPDRRFA